MLTETTTIKHVEIEFKEGAPFHVFRETRNAVLKDGVEIASNFHRESYPLDSDEARAVLGDALAGAMAQVQALTAERDGSLGHLAAASAVAVSGDVASAATAALVPYQNEVQRLAKESNAVRGAK